MSRFPTYPTPESQYSSWGNVKEIVTYIPVIVLALVFLLIAVRQIGRFTLKIWQIMLGGALVVLLAGQISPYDAFHAIDADVMIFLFGMFIVGEALGGSGYLAYLSGRFFRRAGDTDRVVLCILFGMGFLAALLMNDTIAIIGTPLVIGLAADRKISPKLLLLALAVAVTTGSVMSPSGNPQNLLVALYSGMPAPFVTFGIYLIVPTIASLLIAYGVLRIVYRREFAQGTSGLPVPETPGIPDPSRVLPVQISLAVILLLVAANITASVLFHAIAVPLPLIALCGALPVLLLDRDRVTVLKRIDWCTLVFFGAMFILMASVWETGFFQSMVSPGTFSTIPSILGLSVLVSQFISNVPFVALFQPLIQQAGGGTVRLMALAAGSTLAGNLTILGAASNVIIIQNAEKQGQTITFFEFLKVGIPITVLQIPVYWGWLAMVG